MSATHDTSKIFADRSQVAEIRSVIEIIANKMTIPLFLVFWIADLIYAPQYKWEFLGLRLLVVPLCLIVQFFSKKLNSEDSLKKLLITYAILAAAGINAMIAILPDPTTPYYAGLGLVAIGSLSFMPLSKREFAIAAFGIYLPYYLIMALKIENQDQFNHVAINSFFVVSSIIICFLVRFFQEELRDKEYRAKKQLEIELHNREEIIQKKTLEGVKLSALSSQFSPQIVESIRQGKIDIYSSGQRSEICAVFIDIVNSTERVNRIDKDKVEKVLSKFLDDTIKILLKYDITIDKFLGDGLLAFCNAPLKRSDFTARCILAALEIREKIKTDQDFYERYWQKELEIRVGISKGYANVGFYGSQKYFRSYTAIGSVVNLASRLCSAAQAGQILVDHDVYESVQDQFRMEFSGKKTLKGFNDDVIHTFEVIESKEDSAQLRGSMDCPTCGSLLTLEKDAKGHFVFVCTNCCSTSEVATTKTTTKSAA